MPKATTSIPLLCSLCPKSPNFSDISHLLTHISSKSHLSHRFKLQIRSQAEPEAKESLEIYDAWYQNNGLETLLSSRLAAKEIKKEAKAKREKAKVNKDAKGTAKKETKEPKKSKKEEAPKKDQTLASTPVYRAPAPRVHLWSTNTATPTPVREIEKTPRILYETPTLRREVPNFSMQQTPHPIGFGQQLTTPWKPGSNDDEDSSKKIPDSAKLKGVYWPGMDLFDSATPEQKRMRNQRKDGSVLEQMIATSAGVEPLEISYHADGNFRTSRDIFGPPSIENSPEKAPTPKKRKTRRKAALKELSINIPRLRAPEAEMSGCSPQKRPAMQARENIAQHALHQMPTVNPFAAIGAKYAPSAEENEEFRLTIGDMGRDKGKKRAFSIFQDATEESPGLTESPLEEFIPAGPQRFRFPIDGLPTFSSDNGLAAYASPTPVARPTALRFLGKENGQPDINSQRSGPIGHVNPSEVFQDQIYNPLYTQSYTQSLGFGSHDFDEGLKPAMSNFFGDFKPAEPTFDGMNVTSRGRTTNSEYDSSTNYSGNSSTGGMSFRM